MRDVPDTNGKKKKNVRQGKQLRNKPKKSTVSTRNILFIVSGAFDQLGENIRKRLDLNRIGFGSAEENISSSESANRFLSQAETRDFIDYGFEPEFIGRLPVRVSCEELNKDDLAQILNSSEGNVLEQYKNDFSGYDISIEIGEDAIEKIAEKAAEEKTGARGLVTILEKTFRDFKFELPSTAIRDFSVSANTVENPGEELEILQDSMGNQELALETNSLE
jgi:ATP-dependent Clp protease ATP-binding subunit ClpX